MASACMREGGSDSVHHVTQLISDPKLNENAQRFCATVKSTEILMHQKNSSIKNSMMDQTQIWKDIFLAVFLFLLDQSNTF